MVDSTEQTFGFGPFQVVVVVLVVVMGSGGVVWCGVEPPRQVAAGPLGLRSGKKKHNFFYFISPNNKRRGRETGPGPKMPSESLTGSE